jgi:hypothetical protein
VVFEISLYYEAAQGMADEHRPAAQFVSGGMDVVDIVGNGTRAQRLGGGAGTVSAQAQCDRAIARICDEVQEVFPTPRAMPTAVNEKQRHGMRCTTGPLVDHLEHGPDSSIRRRRFAEI